MTLDRLTASPNPRRATGLATIAGGGAPLSGLVGRTVHFSLGVSRGQPPLARSSLVEAEGVLSPLPRRPARGSFEERLALQGIEFTLTRGRLVRVVRPAGAYGGFCERLAARMRSVLGLGLERRPDVAAVYRAMMLGQKQDLSGGQRQLFLRSGTMHLFAINGLHIGIVAVSMHALLALLRVPRGLAAAAVLVVLWLDVDTTGASPSAVRAFLMVALLEAPVLLRLPSSPLSALSAAAVLVALLDPRAVFGASFQMSYGVVAAILTLGLPLGERLGGRFAAYPDLSPARLSRVQRLRAAAHRHFFGALGVGTAATLVGSVTGIEYFGLFAPAGLVANLALAPLAALVIVAGVLSICLGLAGASAASHLLNAGSSVLLRTIQGLIALGLRIPHVWFGAHYRAPWIGPACLAFILVTCLAGYAARWRRERGGFWPPFAAAALALVFGVKFSLNAGQ